MKNSLFFIIILSLLFFGCKKDEETPAEPSTFGTIKGKVQEEGSNRLLSNVNVYSEPATSFVTTDGSGSYSIYTVLPGDYILYAMKSEYDTTSISVSVTAGSITTGDFTLKLADTSSTKDKGIITGIVRDTKNNQPISNVNIYTSPATHSVSTNLQGKFTIYAIPAGEYLLTAEKVGYDTLSLTVKVELGNTAVADFYLTESDTATIPTTGNILGTVVEAVSKNPLAGALVSTDPSTQTVSTDEAGVFKINQVLPGEYKVNVVKSGYQLSTTTITVIAGLDTQADMVMISSTGSVEGIISDAATSQPLQGVIVSTNPGSSTVTTDSSGKYKLNNLTPGTITVSAVKNGYTQTDISVVVIAGETTNADIAMQPDSP